jgi:hypothetical protein
MSLINDALKRAQNSQQNSPPSGAPPLPPVESQERGGTGWILVVAFVLFLAAACFFIGPALFGHKPSPAAAAKSQEISAPPAEAAPAPPLAPASTPETNSLLPPVADTNPPPSSSTAEQPPKVQGIIFNAARPVAIVDGKAVSVGDRVGDFQVKQILKNSVIFQRSDGSQQTQEIGE